MPSLTSGLCSFLPEAEAVRLERSAISHALYYHSGKRPLPPGISLDWLREQHLSTLFRLPEPILNPCANTMLLQHQGNWHF